MLPTTDGRSQKAPPVSKKRNKFISATGTPPGFGSVGRKIKVHSNYYPVRLLPKGTIYHYDIKLRKCQDISEQQPLPRSPEHVVSAEESTILESIGRQQLAASVAAARQEAGNDEAVASYLDGDDEDGDPDVAAAAEKATRMPKRLKRQLVELWQEQNRSFFENGSLLGVYDGEGNFYTIKKLLLVDGRKQKFVVYVPADQIEGYRARSYVLIVKLVAQLQTEDLHAALSQPDTPLPINILTALQCVMREALTRWCPTPAQRTFFFPEGRFDLSGRPDQDGWSPKDAWPGIFISLRPNIVGITMTLDISHTALSKRQWFDDYYANFVWHETKRRPHQNGFDVYDPNAYMPPEEIRALRDKIERQVCGVKVQTDYSGVRRWRCCGISAERLDEIPLADGSRRRIVDYFRQQYGINVRHPHLPAVIVGSETNPKYLPMTLCTIMEGQRMGRKLAELEVANMVRSCATAATDRQRQIQSLRSNPVVVSQPGISANGPLRNPFDQIDNPYMREFGVSVQPNMVEVDARLLPAPVVVGGQNQRMVVYEEQATFDSTKGKAVVPVKPVELNDWALLNLDSEYRLNNRAIDRFLQCPCRMGKARMGSFPKPKNYDSCGQQIDPNDFERAYQSLESIVFNGAKPQLLMIITPRKNSPVYAVCKQYFDVQVGVKTQMVAADILAKNISSNNDRALPMYVSNLLLKINAKLNGANQMVAYGNSGMAVQVNRLPGLKKLIMTPTMVFGADVTHPSPGSDAPSIAAMTASMDKFFCEFRARVRAQKARQEIIEDMEIMTAELIREFKEKHGRLPMQIIFYRDGVSEGQLESVWTNEVAKLRKACGRFAPNIGVTYIIVGKRHHTRLFPYPGEGVGTAGNVLPGTIVDRGICHYAELDYYLCSHFGIQGTSRPAHYHVLADFNDLDVDTLQVLSYYLCYAYQRCLRAVSVPAPAYYAHHAAFRARGHSDSMFASHGNKQSLDWCNEKIQLHADVRNTQYFC